MMQKRAAILVRVNTVGVPPAEEQREVCRRYCREQGYVASEHHVYQSETEPFYASTPQLVQLRFQVVQRQLDVLVIPWSWCVGPLPLWRSLPTARFVKEFYKYHVRIESVMKRNGVHDITQQMYGDAIRCIEQVDIQQIERSDLFKRNDQDEEE